MHLFLSDSRDYDSLVIHSDSYGHGPISTTGHVHGHDAAILAGLFVSAKTRCDRDWQGSVLGHHTQSTAFRHLPPKWECRKPLLRVC